MITTPSYDALCQLAIVEVVGVVVLVGHALTQARPSHRHSAMGFHLGPRGISPNSNTPGTTYKAN